MLTVRYFAAARAAADCASEQVPVPGPLDREALVQLLVARHPQPPPGEPSLETVIAQSSLLVQGVTMRPGSVVEAGATVDILPPFSGG